MLRPIPIKDIAQAPARLVSREFRQTIQNFESLTPVDGTVDIRHQGNFLEVSGKLKVIVTLGCHRCLQTYNYRLSVEPSEILWLQEPAPATPDQEVEIELDDLVESLAPDDNFDVEDWVYQQLCLGLPIKQLCNVDCTGVETASSEEETVDARWSALKQLKEQMQ